jgi:hypothetical protein
LYPLEKDKIHNLMKLTNRNLQDGETYGRIDTKMFMGNYRLI